MKDKITDRDIKQTNKFTGHNMCSVFNIFIISQSLQLIFMMIMTSLIQSKVVKYKLLDSIIIFRNKYTFNVNSKHFQDSLRLYLAPTSCSQEFTSFFGFSPTKNILQPFFFIFKILFCYVVDFFFTDFQNIYKIKNRC